MIAFRLLVWDKYVYTNYWNILGCHYLHNFMYRVFGKSCYFSQSTQLISRLRIAVLMQSECTVTPIGWPFCAWLIVARTRPRKKRTCSRKDALEHEKNRRNINKYFQQLCMICRSEWLKQVEHAIDKKASTKKEFVPND